MSEKHMLAIQEVGKIHRLWLQIQVRNIAGDFVVIPKMYDALGDVSGINEGPIVLGTAIKSQLQ